MAEHEDLICSIWSTHRGIPLTDAAQKSAQKTKYLKKSFNVTWGMFDVDFDTQWWNTKAKHSQADLIFLLTYRYLIYRKTTICAILIGFWKISQLQLYIYIYIKKNFKKSCHMLSKIFGLSTLPIYTVCVPILVNKILGVVCILH